MAKALFAILLLFLSLYQLDRSKASSIPSKFDGFSYSGSGSWEDSILIEAFFDPLCPDSRDAWPPLKKVVEQFSSQVSLIVHPFPLPNSMKLVTGGFVHTILQKGLLRARITMRTGPNGLLIEDLVNDSYTNSGTLFHNNAFLACRALHIANNLNSSSTYDLLELFFKYQERYYNGPTANASRLAIQKDMSKLGAFVLGNSFLNDFESGFEDSSTDLVARISFRYGSSRGVYGAPFFFVNGFLQPDAGSPLSYSQWINIIEPLLENNAGRNPTLSFYL